MAHGGGRILVLLVAIAIGLVGPAMIRLGATKSFLKDLQPGQASRKTGDAVERLGSFGTSHAGWCSPVSPCS